MDVNAPQAMQDQFDELVRMLLRMQPQPREVTVRDEEGQIAVSFDAEARLSRIVVESRWVERIEPETLAETILMTVAEAQLQASGLDDEEAAEPTEAEVAAKRTEIFALGEAQLMAPSSEASLQSKIDNLPNLFDQLDDALDRLDSKLAETQPPISMEEAEELGLEAVEGDRIASDNAMVTLTVNQGMVVDVTLHPNWLNGRSGIVLTECFDQIIAQLHDTTN